MNEYNKNSNVTFEHKNTLIVTGSFLVGLALGAGVFAFFGSPGSSGDNETLQQEHEALKEAIRQEHPEYFAEDLMNSSYSGTVEEVKNDSILVRVLISETVLLASDLKEVKEVNVDENTRIVRRVQKSEEEFQRELAEYDAALVEYQRQLQALPEEERFGADINIFEPVYPSLEREEEITLAGISVGDRVSVDALDPANPNSFTAFSIFVSTDAMEDTEDI